MDAASHSLLSIPADCLFHTVRFLDLSYLFRISNTCKSLCSLFNETVWQQRYEEEIPYFRLDHLTWKQNCARHVRGLYPRKLWTYSHLGKQLFYFTSKNYLLSHSKIDHKAKTTPYQYFSLDLTGSINACDFRYNGANVFALVASASMDAISIGYGIDAKSFVFDKKIMCKMGVKRCLTEVKWHNHDVIGATSDGKLIYWNLSGDNPDYSTPSFMRHAHDAFVSCLMSYCMKRTRLVFSGAADGSIQGWETSEHSLKNIGSFHGHKGPITSLCYIACQRLLITGSALDTFISCIFIEQATYSMKCIHSFQAHEGVSVKFTHLLCVNRC